MIYSALPLGGVVLMTPQPLADSRGFFARLLDAGDMAARGMIASFVQQSMAFNTSPGTIRGLHYQRDPFGETKIVRCTRSAVYDIVVDIRTGSDTFGKWVNTCLDGRQRTALYVPPQIPVEHGEPRGLSILTEPFPRPRNVPLSRRIDLTCVRLDLVDVEAVVYRNQHVYSFVAT